MKKSPAGRKPKFSKEIVSKLELALRADFTVERACREAGISRETYYKWCRENPDFLTKMLTAQDWLKNYAARKLVDGLQKGTISPLEVLKRRDRKRWGDGTDLTTGGQPIMLGLPGSQFVNAAKAPASAPDED